MHSRWLGIGKSSAEEPEHQVLSDRLYQFGTMRNERKKEEVAIFMKGGSASSIDVKFAAEMLQHNTAFTDLVISDVNIMETTGETSILGTFINTFLEVQNWLERALLRRS